MRNVLTQLAGTLTDAGFTALASAYSLPAGLTLSFAKAIAKGTMQGVMQNCYDEVQSMALSKREIEKHNLVFDFAERTYFEFAVKDLDSASSHTIIVDDAYLQQVFETAEHISLEAIRQSELKKIMVLGRYYGREFYLNGPHLDFQDMHQMITMVGTMTYRQIVLIRLIAEEFKGIDKKLFISNPSACVEINRLRDYGIWQTSGAAFGINESWAIQIESLIPTLFTDKVSESLMLDKLSDEDIKRTVDSLRLTEDGRRLSELTEEEFNRKTTFDIKGETLVLPGGKKYGGDPDEEMFLYDLVRGK